MKTIALIPAYNASKTIRSVISRIPRDLVNEILVVNDGSADNTLEVLQGIKGIHILNHEKNKGYGAAQVTLYKAALAHAHDYTVIFHADGGHYPEEVPLILEPLTSGSADVVIGSRIKGIFKKAPKLLGSRFLGAALKGSMPAYKFLGHFFLTHVQNFLLKTNYHSFHCGFRACNRKTLEEINWDLFSNWYLFDMEFLLQVHRLGKRIVEVPASSYYDPNSGSSVPNIRYGLKVLGFSLQQYFRRLAFKEKF